MFRLVFLSAATLFLTSHISCQLMAAKNLPRIGRSYIWKSTIPGPAYDRHVRGYAGDEYFLKAAKSVPRIGRRDDGGFLKAGKSIPRIGRRNDEYVQEDMPVSVEGKRSFDSGDVDMGYYGGGAGFSNDDHWVYKRNVNTDASDSEHHLM